MLSHIEPHHTKTRLLHEDAQYSDYIHIFGIVVPLNRTIIMYGYCDKDKKIDDST